MLIRSQDKLQLIPLEIGSISIDYRNKTHIYFYQGSGAEQTSKLGEYSTEEKALKVLDMIQDYYINKEINIRAKVFQMPLDSEVE